MTVRFTRTFRWNDGQSTDRYLGVEVKGEGLVWFAWSHVFGEGRTELGQQTFAEFRQNGPHVAVPSGVRAELARLLDALDEQRDPE